MSWTPALILTDALAGALLIQVNNWLRWWRKMAIGSGKLWAVLHLSGCVTLVFPLQAYHLDHIWSTASADGKVSNGRQSCEMGTVLHEKNLRA